LSEEFPGMLDNSELSSLVWIIGIGFAGVIFLQISLGGRLDKLVTKLDSADKALKQLDKLDYIRNIADDTGRYLSGLLDRAKEIEKHTSSLDWPGRNQHTLLTHLENIEKHVSEIGRHTNSQERGIDSYSLFTHLENIEEHVSKLVSAAEGAKSNTDNLESAIERIVDQLGIIEIEIRG
jgi:hypothetical protein